MPAQAVARRLGGADEGNVVAAALKNSTIPTWHGICKNKLITHSVLLCIETATTR
jgi:hypothetical protein